MRVGVGGIYQYSNIIFLSPAITNEVVQESTFVFGTSCIVLAIPMSDESRIR